MHARARGERIPLPNVRGAKQSLVVQSGGGGRHSGVVSSNLDFKTVSIGGVEARLPHWLGHASFGVRVSQCGSPKLD